MHLFCQGSYSRQPVFFNFLSSKFAESKALNLVSCRRKKKKSFYDKSYI